MEHNKKIREEIWTSVGSLTDTQLNEVVAEGTWSIKQVLEHLYLMEENVIRIIKYAMKSENFEEVGTFQVHLVADRKHKRNAPENLIPSSEFQTLSEMSHKLYTSRSTLEEVVQELSEDDLNKKTFAHPRFGVLSMKQWIDIVGFHEQRHLEQIVEIKEGLAK